MSQPSFQTHLDSYLWDLVDEGIDEALDRIQGQTGVTGLVVDLHCPPVQQVRPHAGVAPRTFRTQGGAQFQPDPACYAGTRIRPVVADWLRKRNPLKAVVEGCRRRGLKVGGRVSACDHPAVAQRYETAGVRDVFGDRSDRRLCPINPDVAEYLRGMVEDLNGNYELDSLEIGQMGFVSSNDLTEDRGLELGGVEAWLRTICLCESCRQLSGRDGIEAESVAKKVLTVLEKAYQTGTSLDMSLEEFVESWNELGAFAEWRSGQMQKLLTSLRRVCRCTLLLGSHEEPIRSGLDLRGLSSWYDIYSHRCERPGTPEVQEAVRDGLGICEHPARLALRLDAGRGCPNSDALVAGVAQAARMGCHSVDIGRYGLLPLDRLEWIRQAVRFARRESAGGG